MPNGAETDLLAARGGHLAFDISLTPPKPRRSLFLKVELLRNLKVKLLRKYNPPKYNPPKYNSPTMEADKQEQTTPNNQAELM